MGAQERRQQQITELAEPVCLAHGVELVEVRQIRGRGGWTLRIIIDRPRHDGKPGSDITLEDCTNVSRDLSTSLDVHEDVMPGTFNLEVSSPGPDRPLTKLTDFERFAGSEVRVRTREPIVGWDDSGRRTFQGEILGLEGTSVLIQLDGSTVPIPHEAIERATLVPSF
ncbi:MAG: ribosome maturation factor RimP [Myxococcota bacterium]